MSDSVEQVSQGDFSNIAGREISLFVAGHSAMVIIIVVYLASINQGGTKNMKIRQKRFLINKILLLFTILILTNSLINPLHIDKAHAEANGYAAKSQSEGQAMMTDSLIPGRIRRCIQASGDSHFVASMWQSSSNNIIGQAGGLCNRASLSMVWSYLNVDCTPVYMQDLMGGSPDTSNGYKNLMANVNNSRNCQLVMTMDSSWNSSALSECYNLYNSNPSYSPIYIWGKYNGGSSEHAMVIIGKEYESNGVARFIIADPSSKSHSQDHVFWMDINTSTGKVQNSSVSNFSDYRIYLIYQWHREDYYTSLGKVDDYYLCKGVTLDPSTQEGHYGFTLEPLFGKVQVDGYTIPYDASEGNNELPGGIPVQNVIHVVEVVENKNGVQWYKTDAVSYYDTSTGSPVLKTAAGGLFIKPSDVEKQYSGTSVTPGIYEATTNTQWGHAPFDAHHQGTDIQLGEQVTVARGIKNKYDNIWYELDSVGSNKWVYSGHFKFIKINVTIDISITNAVPGTGLPKTAGEGIPTGNLNKGSGFGLRGVITASENIASVTATVINSVTGAVITGLTQNPVTVTPNNTNSVDIRYSAINDNLSFESLTDGAYRYTVEATTASGLTKTLIDSSFTVGSGNSEMTSGYDRTLSDGNYMIVNAAHTSFYIDISGTAIPAAGGTNVVLCGDYNGTAIPADVWTLSYSDGFYTIKQMNTDMCLDIENGSTASGANVQVCSSNGSSAQRFAISSVGNGVYQIQAKCSGLALDVENGVFNNGTNIQQCTINGSDAQKWVFIPYTNEPPVTGDYEYATFPNGTVYVSQVAYAGYSHANYNVTDIVPDGDVYAPFTGTIRYKDDNWGYVILESNNKVHYADGTLDYMCVGFMHDDDISDLWVGKTIQKGEAFYQKGVKSQNNNVTGAHVQIGIMRGKLSDYSYYYSSSANVYIYNAFFLTETTNITQSGYEISLWKYLNQQAPTNDKIRISLENASPASGLPKTAGTGVPYAHMPANQSFGLRGVITADENIASVTATVYNVTEQNVATEVTIYPNSTSADIRYSDINNNIIFNAFNPGTYRYTVVVTTVSGYTETVIDAAFSIGDYEPCGHDYEWTTLEEATCTTCGFRQKVCRLCGHPDETQEIEMADHVAGERVETKEATCTDEGTFEVRCSNCNVLLTSGTISPLGHTEVIDAAVAATWYKTGLSEGSHCAICNQVLVPQQAVPSFSETVAFDFVVPTSLQTIEDEAFAGVAAVNVKLGENVTGIGNRAFANCKKLKWIYIPASTATISDSAFDGTEDLTILGYKNTEAERYAARRGYAFETLIAPPDISNWVLATDAPENAEIVNTKTQYSFRERGEAAYSEWSEWGPWLNDPQQITDSNLKQEETATKYRWWAAKCLSCGHNNPYWKTNCKTCGSYLGDVDTQWISVLAFSDDTSGTQTILGRSSGRYFDGEPYWNENKQVTAYRYRTRTISYDWSAWSEWSDTPVTATETLEVRTRIMVQYRLN